MRVAAGDRLPLGRVAERGWLVAIISAAAAMAVYACTLRGTYVYDDVPVAQLDPRLTHPSLWGQYWTRAFTIGPDKPYRPLVSMTFALQRVAHGDRAWAFHLVNILLHAAVSAQVAWLGVRLAGERAGLIAGVLFAVHPAHVEVVAEIAARSESICALFTLGGLLSYLGGSLNGWRVARIAVCAVAAPLCKEQGLLLPLILLAAVPLRRSTGLAAADRPTSRAALIAALCYAACTYLLLRELTLGFWWDHHFLEWVMNPMIRSRGLDRVLMPLVLMGRYVALLLVPRRQSFDYGGYAIGHAVRGLDPYLMLGAAAAAIWAVLTFTAWRRSRPAMLLCLLSVGLLYAMIGNIFVILPTIFAERLIYLPSAFLLVLAGMALARLRSTMASMLITAALAGSWAVAAVRYARLWNDPTALFQVCLANQPGSERVHAALFRSYANQGAWTAAERVAQDCVARLPDADQGYAMCAEADLALGDVRGARAALDRGMRSCGPDDRPYLMQWYSSVDAAAQQATTAPAATQP